MKNNYKLKIICLLCAFTAVLSSCKKNEQSLENGLVNNHNKLASAGDGENDLLGYGYDVTGEYANSSAAKYSVIDIKRLKTDQPTRVEWDESSKKYGEIIAGENVVSYLKGLTNKLGAGLSIKDPDAPVSTDPKAPAAIPLFKASIDNSFDNSESYSSKYVYSSYALKIQQKRVKMNADIALLQQYLTSSFVADVQNGTPQSIVSAYGTHVLKDIVLGAKLDINYRAETNKTDRKEAASTGIDVSILGIFSINSKTTTTEQQTTDNTNQRLSFKAIGGEPGASLFGNIAIGSTLPTISTKEWENSSTLANAEMIDIVEDGLIPIWDLIADPVKSAAVKAYVTQYLIDGQAKLNIDVAALYRYYNGTDHYYTKVSGNYPGYHLEGIEGYLYKYQETGTGPLYRYYNGTDHYYTTVSNNYPGYHLEGIEGYLYKYQFPGTVPLYRYYNWTEHFYATASGNYPGYHSEGIEGYIYKTKP